MRAADNPHLRSGLDLTRSGARDYTEAEARRVRATLLSAGAMTVDDLARMSGVLGRTVRQILADGDGVDYLLAGGDEGVALAEYAEEGEALTRRIENQAATMRTRAERRRAYAEAHLPRRQARLL